ncbi:hypothetical protein APHAL10511_003562 [Amanita phalloides]|nr:hypothetical protein APHAL10511_003562 [Amanita phalloides]
MQKLRLGFAIVALALFGESAAVSTNTSDDLVYDDRQVHARTWVLPLAKRNTGRNGITKRHPADPAPHQPLAPVATVELFRSKRGYWLANIEIGTHRPKHPQQFSHVVPDTGSSSLWVTSSKIPNPGSSNTYNPRLSSSSDNLHRTFELHYAAGSCEGPTYSDIVNVGGMKVKMAFGSVTKRDPNMEEGVLGLGLSPPAPPAPPELQFFHAAQNTPAYHHFNPLAAFCFGMKDLAELYLGHVKDSAYLGEIEYHPVVQLSDTREPWAIGGGEISLGGTTTVVTSIRTVLDTGGQVILGPPGEVKNIYDKIPDSHYFGEDRGQGLYIIPCKPKPGREVEVSFRWNNGLGLGEPWVILPEDFAIPIPGEKTWCKGAIAGKVLDYDKNAKDLWQAGDIFFRDKLVIFDARNKRVGLARAKKGCGH